MKTMKRTLTYGADTFGYEVRFLASRQTLSIEVHPNCRVLVRAPVGCSEALIADRVRKRAAWITRQLAGFERYTPRTPPRQHINGESHLYLGRQYRLKVISGSVVNAKLTRDQLLVTLPEPTEPSRVKAVLHRWYIDRARETFGEILDAKLSLFDGVEKPRLIVRTMQSRWGSLSNAGTMTLNVNLIRAPRACIEYVVVHELCHTQHRNHDKRFGRLLQQRMPDWERRKHRLESALL
ncbi:M48 family metallopeptidase [Lysobacter sp. 13A]|uniref:M48 family metallopeptidase n=2 Tax=Novilysobacter selenitireducens TaxID=2872639 RepID=A0ABS7T2H9_9GAMM|nr:M48 family metallopeptidase [Lysobacter selenitireducens]